MKISADTAKCAGQAPDGTQKCAYREACLRFAAPANERQAWEDFWRGGDDCPQYLSIPKVSETSVTKPIRGFGFVLDLATMKNRKWYINDSGVKCWHDNDKPCNLVDV